MSVGHEIYCSALKVGQGCFRKVVVDMGKGGVGWGMSDFPGICIKRASLFFRGFGAVLVDPEINKTNIQYF